MSKLEAFSSAKKFVQVGDYRIAYYEEGEGQPLLLLHGCPFSSFIWRKVIPLLSGEYRCLAPDLLGLGDTETPAGTDWSLPAQAEMISGFLDALGLDTVHLVGHDHGGALAQLLAAEQPQRIQRLVITNAEAYDNWPSPDERPFVRLTQVPLLGRAFLWASSLRPVARLVFASAVSDKKVLTAELLDGYIRANLSDGRRRARTRRFLAGQLDADHNRCTVELLDGLKRFDKPTMIVWGQDDPHFGPEWAEKLYQDIPGAYRLEFLPGTGHLLMEERPQELASLILDFLSQEPVPARKSLGAESSA
ncbi:MAG: alpha/beta hydrolase [Dehalococcoidia bacterium]